MTRLRSFPILLLALVVAGSATLSACAGGRSGVALTVNGTSLSNQDFLDWVSALNSNKVVPAQLQSTDGRTYSTALTTAVLNQQVEFAVVESELAKRHITLTSSELSTAESTAESNLGGASIDPQTGQQVAGDPTKGKAVLDKLGSFKTAYVRYLAGQTALEEDYAKKRGSPAELEKLFEAHKAELQNQACVTILEVVATTGQTDASGNVVAPTAAQKAAALAKANQIRAGITSDADFVKVAKEMAAQEGSSNGGDLGCAAKGTYATQAPALDSAIWTLPVGEVSQPIAVTDGYLLARVSARGNLTLDQVKDQLQQAAAQQSVTDYQNWLSKAVKQAEVSVDPQWGSWNDRTGLVVAPVGATTSLGTKAKAAASSTTLAPTATTPASTP